MEKLARCEGDFNPGDVTERCPDYIRRDERVVLEIDQQGLWAKDVLYHTSCYRGKRFTVASPASSLRVIVESEVAKEDADHVGVCFQQQCTSLSGSIDRKVRDGSKSFSQPWNVVPVSWKWLRLALLVFPVQPQLLPPRFLLTLHLSAADLFRIALSLRSDILSMEDQIPFPMKPSDMTEDKVNVPNSLFNFLVWVLLGDVTECTPVSLERIPFASH